MGQIKSYQIQWRRRPDKAWLPLLWYGYFVTAVPYVVWRSTVVNWHVWYGPVMYVAELYGIMTTGLFLFVAKKVFVPQRLPALVGKTVDVLIPTFNEPLDVLEPVVIGAAKIRGVRNVLVLDDSERPDVKAMAKRHGARYVARPTHQDAKAGNMNYGMQYTDAEFIITLDADHIPLPGFLEETLGFFINPKLAFVQSPQTFYNTHSFLFRRRRGGRTDWNEQMMFYNCLQPAKNNWNAAFFVGTSAMLRRSALDSVGGFATGTATEDIHTSLRLHAKGWQSIFLPKPLAYGLEAESFKEFYKQRRRWAAGSLGLLFRSADSPLRTHGLTLPQRLNYLSACSAHLQGLQKICFIIIPVLTIFTNISPVAGNLGHFLAIFAGYVAVALASTWAYARGTYHPIYTEMYSLASILSHLGGLWGVLKVQKKFAVSSKLSHRREGIRLVLILWGVGLLALMALGRAAASLVLYHRHTMLVLSSLISIVASATLLVSFLILLWAYERSTITIHYQQLRPNAMYQFIAKHWRLHSWHGEQSVNHEAQALV